MKILLACLYTMLGILILFVEIKRVRAKLPFNALSFFNGAYFVFFVFVPLNVLAMGETAVRQKYAYQTWSHGDMWTALSFMFSYSLFVLGYYRRCNHKGLSRDIILGPHLIPIAHRLIGSLFLLGCISLVYHVSLMGGFVEALKYAPGARTGEFRLDGQMLFIRQFAFFLSTAFMLSWAVYIESDESEPRCRMAILSFFLGIVFVYYALSTYGRREFLYPLFICLIIWAVAGKRRLWGGLSWLLTLGLLWFVMYTFIIPAISQPAISQPAISQPAISQHLSEFLRSAYLRTTQGLGDSFMHFVAAEHAKLWQFGFLADLWEIPGQFLPSQVLGFERSRGMFGETSAFILGRPLSPGLSGEEPLGLHGYLLVNFSYLGMFLLFYLGGVGYRILDTRLKPEIRGSALGWLVFLWIIIGSLEFLREGVLILVLKPRFSWWFAIVILLWFGYRRAARPNSLTI